MKIQKILETKNGDKYFVKDVTKDFHTKFGVMKAEVMKNAKDGDTIFSDHHEECVIYSPQFIDNYMKIKRAPQIVPLKDIGFIITELGLGKNSIVAEGGSGSGGVCCFLANVVKKVYTFEINDDNIAIVKDNITELGFDNIELKKQSMYESFGVNDLDAVFMDLPEPWLAINSVKDSLKIGGFVISYSPHLTSVLDYVNVLKEDKSFSIIKTIEIIEQPWEVRERKARPKSERMHSGFLTVARKIRN